MSCEIKPNGNWIRIYDNGTKKGILSPVAQIDRHYAVLESILENYVDSKNIHKIICIAHPTAIIEGEDNCHVPIVKSDVLNYYIKNICSKNSYVNIDVNLIKEQIEKFKV